MEKLKFSTSIQAPKEVVWKALWDNGSYEKWTAAFCEGSYVQTDGWKENTKVLFLSPAGEGLVSTVAANKPNSFMSFRHEGVVKDGIEDTTSESVQAFAGAFENYLLEEREGQTVVEVELDITAEYAAYFQDTWPKALENLKNLAEGNGVVHISRITDQGAADGGGVKQDDVKEQGITTFLCFKGNAEEAVHFYTSVFPGARISSTVVIPGSPETGNRDLFTATFFLNGQEFYALDGGPGGSFSPSMSLMVKCHTQEEVDHLWDKLSEGGEEQQCGWLRDKYGISWQIIPVQLQKLMYRSDPERGKKVWAAMLQMKKIVISDLERAYNSD